MRQHHKQFGRKSLMTQKEAIDGNSIFNEEELYYLNRIMFRLVKRKGSTGLRFDKFVKDIATLQGAPMPQRLKLWLNCVCELDEDIYASVQDKSQNPQRRISRQKFGNVVRASFPQDIAKKASFEMIIDKIFSNGLDESRPLDQCHKFIMENTEALNLMKCVLQFEDVNDLETGGF